MTLDIFALLVVIKAFYSCFVYMSLRSTCAFLFVQDPVNLTHFYHKPCLTVIGNHRFDYLFGGRVLWRRS